MARSMPRSFLEIAALAFLGLLGMGSLAGVLIGALVPDAGTGQLALQNSTRCASALSWVAPRPWP